MDDSVERHCRQYWQRLDLKSLTWPDAELLEREEVQQRICNAITQEADFDDPENLDLDTGYVKQYLKRLFARIKGPEPLDALYDVYSRKMSQPKAGTSVLGLGSALPENAYYYSGYTLPYKSYSNQTGPDIRVLENPTVLSGGGGTGHRTWEASLNFGTQLSEVWLHQHILGKTVLELGCGTGLVSLACLLYGASNVVATDGDAAAIGRLNRAQLAGAAGQMKPVCQENFKTHHLLWGDAAGLQELPVSLAQIDTVLAADVTYDPAVVPKLASTLDMLLKARPDVVIFIVATARNLGTLKTFEQACGQAQMETRLMMQTLPPPLSEQRGFYHMAEAPIHYVRIVRSK